MKDPFLRRRVRGRLVRLRMPLLVLLVAGVLAAAAWVVFSSSLLGVQRVTYTGLGEIPGRRVADAAAIRDGDPLARLDLAAVEARVEAIPAVSDATVTRHWPTGVTVDVTPRVAVAVVSEDSQLQAMDAEGVLFERLTKAPAGLPMIRPAKIPGEQRAAALAEVARVVVSLDPGIAAKVDHVRVSSIDSIGLVLTSGDQVRWGSAEGSGRKAKVLRVLMRIKADVYDVSVPDQPTTSRS